MRDYHERLAVPVAWWILAVPVIVLLGGYGIYANLSGPVVVIIYTVFTVGGAAALLMWGSSVIEVGDGELRAAGAVLPLSRVTEVRALDARQAEAMRGPRADPAAHMLIRPYLKTAVYHSGTRSGRADSVLADRDAPASRAGRRDRAGPPRGVPAASQGSAG